jgi:hypothetical protein
VAQIGACFVRHGAFAIIVGDSAAVSQTSREQARGQQQTGNEFHGSIRDSKCGDCAAAQSRARAQQRKHVSKNVLHPAGAPRALLAQLAGENSISLTL